MPNCEVCRKELPFPFECEYCGRIYCAEHRNPKDHQCPWQIIFQKQHNLKEKEISGEWSDQKQQVVEGKPYLIKSTARKESTTRMSKHISGFGEKNFKLSKWHVLTSFLVLVVIIQTALCVNFYQGYSVLNSEYQNSELQRNSLQYSYDVLKAEYDSLLAQYNSLYAQFDSLISQYTELQSRYDALQASYNSLQNSYNLLVSQYNRLRYEINLRSQLYEVKMFVTPNDSTVRQIVNQITGGWSNPSDWNEFWTDIKTMYDWVVNNVKYRSDGLFPVLPSSPSGSVYYATQVWQFPNETLNLREGDCEDMATLLCSMILCYTGERYWTECVWITSSSSAHVGVQIPVSGGKIVILDPAGKYYTKDIWGNLVSKDISTEVNNWLNYWMRDMGNDVRVYRVFANYIDKTFSSTSEYISWMYSR
ncbi:MAG: AN1-type zinc finger domain-containing protein [Candidatus Bathyarchaeia archaeon]